MLFYNGITVSNNNFSFSKEFIQIQIIEIQIQFTDLHI